LTIDTGDARKLPYPDDSYDVAMSMTAIHIPDKAGREAAITEMWRVAKPSGQILIFDIRHARWYLDKFPEFGAADAKLSGPIFLSALKPATESGTSRKPDFAV
jgi:arsenite methyltransferase